VQEKKKFLDSADEKNLEQIGHNQEINFSEMRSSAQGNAIPLRKPIGN